MFGHYLKVALKNAVTRKTYSLINVAGLAIGMACCMVILVYIVTELGYDRYHENARNIYRLGANLTLGGTNSASIGTSRITSYFVSHDSTWNEGPCVDGAECLVMAKIATYFDDWCENGKCGRLVLFEGWGNVTPADDGDLNPYTDDQWMAIDELNVFFKGIGKNRTVATCTFTNPGITVITDSPLD